MHIMSILPVCSLQSSVSSSGKTVVDHGANQELQEANTRLRERLARMVLYREKTHICTHMHAKSWKAAYCTRTKDMASHTHSISNREMGSELYPKTNSNTWAQKNNPFEIIVREMHIVLHVCWNINVFSVFLRCYNLVAVDVKRSREEQSQRKSTESDVGLELVCRDQGNKAQTVPGCTLNIKRLGALF